MHSLIDKLYQKVVGLPMNHGEAKVFGKYEIVTSGDETELRLSFPPATEGTAADMRDAQLLFMESRLIKYSKNPNALEIWRRHASVSGDSLIIHFNDKTALELNAVIDAVETKTKKHALDLITYALGGYVSELRDWNKHFNDRFGVSCREVLDSDTPSREAFNAACQRIAKSYNIEPRVMPEPPREFDKSAGFLDHDDRAETFLGWIDADKHEVMTFEKEGLPRKKDICFKFFTTEAASDFQRSLNRVIDTLLRHPHLVSIIKKDDKNTVRIDKETFDRLYDAGEQRIAEAWAQTPREHSR